MLKYRLEIPRDALHSVLSATKIPVFANSGAYILFHFRNDDSELIIYDNSKDKPYNAIFRGSKLPSYLKDFDPEEIVEEPKTVATKILDIEQIGSDEVGFGDFFGPLVVVSAYINASIREKIATFAIDDSKKLSDDLILMMGPKLAKIVPHVKNIVLNPKYNEVINSGKNMNEMKVLLHHNVLVKLARRQNYHGNLYIDKFTTKSNYDKITKDLEKAPIVLVPSGESASLAIATASVLARYYFLLEMAKISNLYNEKIPLGAGVIVDEFARKFLIKHGRSNLESITKHNFRNFKDLGEDA